MAMFLLCRNNVGLIYMRMYQSTYYFTTLLVSIDLTCLHHKLHLSSIRPGSVLQTGCVVDGIPTLCYLEEMFFVVFCIAYDDVYY